MAIDKLVYLCLIFADLALVMGVIIIALPRTWTIWGNEIDPWPLFASFGIGNVVTILHVYNMLDYVSLLIVFWTCFPIILIAAQLKKRYDASQNICEKNSAQAYPDRQNKTCASS